MNWMINRWIDPQGNYIDYTYETENNTQRIKKISWGNNINKATNYENIIEFTYKARLRAEYSYLNYNNIKIEVNKILSFITVKTGGQTFRTYTLEHETVSGNYQRIKKITESNGANEAANPIVFNYDETEEGFSPIIRRNGVTDSDLANVKLNGDFDGNGEQDFVTDSKVYLNPVDNGSNWTGVPFYLGEKYFTATTVINGKLNQFQSIVKVVEASNSINFDVYNLSGTTVAQSYTKNIEINRTGTNVGCKTGTYEKSSNLYYEGDYNGDVVSEMLMIPIV